MTQPDPNAQSGTGTGQSAGDGQGQGTGTTDPQTGQSAGNVGGDGSTSDGTATGGQSAETVSRADHEAILNRMKAADQRAAKAEADLRQLRDKDLPELDRIKRDKQDAEARAEAAETKFREQAVANAFLTNDKHKWKNPATALKLLDRNGIQIDDDGKVTGVEAACDALAKSDPYLLEPKDAGEGQSNNSRGSTGMPGTGGRSGGTQPDSAKMVSRVPALRTRGIGNSQR